MSRLPQVQGRLPPASREPEISQRLAQALFSQREHAGAPPLERVTFDASLTFSARESLQTMDFESMSNEELAAARAALARFRLRLPEVRTRRYAPDPRGERIDPRASLRASLRLGGATIPLRRRSAVKRAPPLVALCDVSGSMNRYTRMFLHFLHATINDRSRVHALTFGTRLTSITRHLQYRDPDVALAQGEPRGEGLVGRHAHRGVPEGIQHQVVAPPARRRAPSCCSSATASIATRARTSRGRWSGCASRAAG